MRSRERYGPSIGVRVVTWGATALIALVMHVGIYLLVMRKDGQPSEAPPQPPAAVMINMSPIPMAAKSETDNAAEGPEAPDSKPAEMTEAEEAPPPPDLVPLVAAPPPPPDVKPQAALPTTPPKKETKPPEKPIKKEIEKKDKPKKPVDKKEKPQVASKSGGGPKSNRNDAVTAASAAGSAVSEVSRASWLGELRSKIVRAKRRPSEARGKFGVALVSVTFSANGVVSSARLVSSSGVPSLDTEAVAVMYRASPYPAPPGGKVTTISIPLNFN
ncbi:TonB family protein [Methylobacterium sp. BTF04]|uniref:energy transducer TonB family protein n=1 Tax=Methylobacterium sp. BTF04 TaxID=2708300 RepID=UPI0019531F6E|nr:TonB family protein [Methylobacterium sp. BTF04]